MPIVLCEKKMDLLVLMNNQKHKLIHNENRFYDNKGMVMDFVLVWVYLWLKIGLQMAVLIKREIFSLINGDCRF